MKMTTDLDEAEYRLPRNARPVRYVLRFEPNLNEATFIGDLALEFEVDESTQQLVMNACELAVGESSIARGWISAGEALSENQEVVVTLDERLERVTFGSASMLNPGHYTLSTSFTGALNDKLCGFYRSTFIDDDGIEHIIATTQFEDTDARKAFPSFDEPDRKAIFEITLDVPNDQVAVSNGPEISNESLAGGKRRVRFGPTIPMSTYIVAFIVGPLEATDAIDVDGIPIRVLTVPGKTHLARHALEAGAHALRFFTSYFDIPYPGEKLDLLALPDFAAGAMENLGCVTFREAILLADPDNASRNELERLAEVVEHEIAHMWFGDLVTMDWWNGIWLNEAFATFMALRAQDDFRPEWETFVSFGRSKAAAFGVDSLHATRPIEFPVHHPDEAAAMFDVLTYEKGAGVLWMIEQFLGEEQFRDGVRRYLKAHLYGNTETGDLWDAIEAEAGEIPIRAIMDSWIFQGGFPLLVANCIESTDQVGVTLSQEPFSYLPEGSRPTSAIGREWLVPVISTSLSDRSFESRVVITGNNAGFLMPSRPVLVNAGGSGFFRVHYDDQSYRELRNNIDQLSGVERFNFVADTWAVILSGRTKLARLSELAESLDAERDPHVWSVIIGAIALLDLVAPETHREELADFTRKLLVPLLKETGWEPKGGDDEQTPLLRSSLISTLGTIGRDPEVITRCREIFVEDHQHQVAADADLIGAVLTVTASHANRDDFEAIRDRYRRPQNPNDQLRHLSAFSQLSDSSLASEVHDMSLDEIRSQDAPYLLGSMLRNRAIGRPTWAFIVQHFDEMVDRFPDNSIHRMLDGTSALAQLDADGRATLAENVQSFCEENIVGARRRQIEQSLERLAINVRLAERLENDFLNSGS